MSWQRKRNGRWATLYYPSVTTDRRGNEVIRPLGGSVRVRFAESFDRSNRAEVPGFQQVEVRSIIVDHRTPGLGLWTRAEIDGVWYDAYAPPAYRHGTRHVRHATILLRLRSDQGGIRDEDGNPVATG